MGIFLALNRRCCLDAFVDANFSWNSWILSCEEVSLRTVVLWLFSFQPSLPSSDHKAFISCKCSLVQPFLPYWKGMGDLAVDPNVGAKLFRWKFTYGRNWSKGRQQLDLWRFDKIDNKGKTGEIRKEMLMWENPNEYGWKNCGWLWVHQSANATIVNDVR